MKPLSLNTHFKMCQAAKLLQERLRKQGRYNPELAEISDNQHKLFLKNQRLIEELKENIAEYYRQATLFRRKYRELQKLLEKREKDGKHG